MTKVVKVLGWLIVLGLVGWLVASRLLLVNQDPVAEQPVQQNPPGATLLLTVGEVVIPVEVRRTGEEMSLGLSYRESLDADAGMAFIYPEPQPVMYWMQHMNFGLDFIFVARGIVVEIMEEVPAPTMDNPVPQTVVPVQEVDMVVEVNAGFVKQRGIRVGDVVKW